MASRSEVAREFWTPAMQMRFGIRPWELKDYRPVEIRQIQAALDLHTGGGPSVDSELEAPMPPPVQGSGRRTVHGIKAFMARGRGG